MAEKNVTQALAAVMAEVRGVGKDGFHDAPGAKFKFRGVDAVVNAVGPALRNHHVIVVPQLLDVSRRDVSTSGGKASRETCVTVKYVFTGPDGSTLEAIVPGEAMDSADKGTAKAMSVAFRIALLQALCLPTDDADPDSHHYERESAPVGRGEQPRNGATQQPADAQPPKPSTVPQARSYLASTCTENSWNLDIVANRFKATTGTDLSSATDVAEILKFRDGLFAVRSHELGAPEPATNGAPR